MRALSPSQAPWPQHGLGLPVVCPDRESAAGLHAVGHLLTVYQEVLPGRWRTDRHGWTFSLSYESATRLARLLIAALRDAGLPLLHDAMLDEADYLCDDAYPAYVVWIPVSADLTWPPLDTPARRPGALATLLAGLVGRWRLDLASPYERGQLAGQADRVPALARILAADSLALSHEDADARRQGLPTPTQAIIGDAAGAFARLGGHLAAIPHLAAYMIGETGYALLDWPQGFWFEACGDEALDWRTENVRDLLELAQQARTHLDHLRRVDAALASPQVTQAVLAALEDTMETMVLSVTAGWLSRQARKDKPLETTHPSTARRRRIHARPQLARASG